MPSRVSRPRLTTALCCLAMMSLAVAVNFLPVFFTTLATDLAYAPGVPLTDEQLGRLGAITCLGLVIGILLTGPLADRFGPRPFTAAGNALIALGLLMLATARSYPAALGATFVMGLGAGVLDMILSPIVSALHPTRRTASLNLLHSFYCAGAVATILAGYLAVRTELPWRTLAAVLIPLPLLLTIAFLPLPLPSLHEAGGEEHPRYTTLQLFRYPFFLLALVAIFLGGSAEMGLAYWLPAYAEKSLGYSTDAAALAFLGFSIAMTVGRMAIPLLPAAHARPFRLMIVSCAAAAVLLLVTSFAPVREVAIGAAVLAGLAGSCLWPSTLAVTADRFPHGPPSMFALLAALGNVGGVTMPWVIGWLADVTGNLGASLATAAVCPVLMIPALVMMSRQAGRAVPGGAGAGGNATAVGAAS